MARASVWVIREQIEAGREFTEKLQEEERAGIPIPIKIPSDAKYAKRLHDKLNDLAQLADEPVGNVVASEARFVEVATSSEDEE